MNALKKSKILTAARSSFLRYGYKRVSMGDIAEAAGMSRAALYLVFKNKEEIFGAVFLHWVDETLADIEREIATVDAPLDKIERAFEIWAVRPLDLVQSSREARELIECSFEFAQGALNQGYDEFERTITPVLASLAEQHPPKQDMDPKMVAHILTSAVRGFKQTATTQTELRALIRELLTLSLARVS